MRFGRVLVTGAGGLLGSYVVDELECEVKARAADPKVYKGPAAGGRQPAGGGVMWHYVERPD